ncbi:zinc metalloproteinase-disintegrin-like batroxstatin-1 isoform X2 [Convolutriloba macropyga]|uniref:zinc metalloproteinase-disintegrin-like batroxstatin-1 isoform X2 n=1 Tax=Convolutriloba macropyga TaxID=536237 RepID=UPI003F51FB64
MIFITLLSLAFNIYQWFIFAYCKTDGDSLHSKRLNVVESQKQHTTRNTRNSDPFLLRGVVESRNISLIVSPVFDQTTCFVDGERRDFEIPVCNFQGHEHNHVNASFFIMNSCEETTKITGQLHLSGQLYHFSSAQNLDTLKSTVIRFEPVTKKKEEASERSRRQATSWLDLPSVKPLKQQDYFRLLTQVTETFLFNRKTISLSIYVDKDLNDDFTNESEVKKYMFKIINTVDMVMFSNLYRTHVVLTEVQIWNMVNLVDISADVRKNLRHFLMHLQTLSNMPDSTVTLLLTGKKVVVPFEHAANFRSICDPQRAAGVIRIYPDKSTDQQETPNTIALVLGKILGLTHDGSSACNCSEGCIMSKFSPYVYSKFSKCSRNEYLQLTTSGRGHCLFDVPQSVSGDKNLEFCGNGVVDPGEECDCGTTLECALSGHSSCCSNCALINNAQCGSGECCSSQCRLRMNGTVCREQMGDCDVAERCDGYSSQCPSNIYKIDATPCNLEQDFCYNGECLTRDHQCQLLYGIQSKSGVDQCYTNLNSAGSSYGNCGDLGSGNFRPCYRHNVHCGMLQCNGSLSTSVRVERVRRFRFNAFDTSSDSSSSSAFAFSSGANSRLNSHQGINDKCSSASVVLDDGTDLGYVAPGTKCGSNRVCSRDSQCMDLRAATDTRRYFICPGYDRSTGHFCSRHGFCSNKRLCVCDHGWTGSDCSLPDEKYLRDTQIPKDDPSTPADKFRMHANMGEWSDGFTYSNEQEEPNKVVRDNSETNPTGIKIEISEVGTPENQSFCAHNFRLYHITLLVSFISYLLSS